ncbi:MAG TPA: carboxymuconolactone decarboxylase family protein [Ilumatobacteraceae bacterium]|jgi:AhpD family alkylhydroperoxidase
MKQRLNPLEVIPDAYRAVFALERHVQSKIDHGLLELVKLRASMINGCAFCVDMHSTDALKNGEDARRLFAVSVWRESPFFSPAERAALALTDAVTRLGEEGVSDEVWNDAVNAYGEATAAELVIAIATINVWNRLSVANHSAPPPL